METGKILVVDDNHAIRIVICEMLSRIGYLVESADSGENGLSIFSKHKFDIVLSDYHMSGMDGVAFASKIKKCSPSTPVVIMTGFGEDTVFSRMGSAVDKVLLKPFTLVELDEMIQSLSAQALCA